MSKQLASEPRGTCRAGSLDRVTNGDRQQISTKSHNAYEVPTLLANDVSLPCRRMGPRMKYQLNVTTTVMNIKPSRARRTRAAAEKGRAGSKRMPSKRRGYVLR